MPIRKGARLHMEALDLVTADSLTPGDIVSNLPGLWSHIALVCELRGIKSLVYLDSEGSPNRLFRNLIPIEDDARDVYFRIPSAAIVPFIDPATFDTGHPGRNGLAVMGKVVCCVGWLESSYALFNVKDGSYVDRSRANPLFITSWDVLTKDVDDEVVSLLEVRPD